MFNVLNFPEQNGSAKQENYNRNYWAQKYNKPSLRDDIVGVITVDWISEWRRVGSELKRN
jgi:hypothetical protein